MKKLAFILLMLLVTSYAEDMVAINSFDGRDVLSGIYYANVKGEAVKFMPTQGGNADIFVAKIGANHDILLIQSATLPVSGFVETNLKAKNNTVELYSSSDGGNTNLELARRSGATSFIVVDSAYSDSAISVLPYAKLTNSYVILANKDNAQEVKQAVGSDKVIIFGLVDKEVSDALGNPQVIGRGEDRYEDNIAIVKKTMDEFDLNRLIMVDGSFIEESMALGDQPILLTGRIVPQPTYNFVKQEVSNGKLAQIMLIGNDLVVPIYDMRNKMKSEFAAAGENKTVGIVVKFAQVIPSAGTSVLVLDTFNLPAYQPSLNISEVAYNKDSGKIMVTVANIGDGAAYFNTEVRVKVDGIDYKSYPAGDAILIGRGESKGMEFPFDMSSLTEGNVTALVVVKFGASKGVLEDYVQMEGPLTTISYVDKSDVSIQSARYSADKKVLQVTLKNNGVDKAYSFTHVGLNMGGSSTTLASSATRTLEPNSLSVEEFPLELSSADLAANTNVKVQIDYGGRPGFLVNTDEKSVSLAQEGGLPILLVLGVAVIVVVIAAAVFLLLPRGKAKK